MNDSVSDVAKVLKVFLMALFLVSFASSISFAQTSQDEISQQIKVHYQKGKELSSAGLYDEAVKEFDKAKQLGQLLESVPDIDKTQQEEDLYEKQKKFSTVKDVEKEEKKASNELDMLNSRISDCAKDLAEIKDKMEKAVAKLKSLQNNSGKMTDIQDIKNYLNSLQDDYADIFYKKSNALLQKNKLVYHLKQLVRLRAVAYYNSAIDYSLKRNTKKAIEMYEEAISVYPEDSDAHYNLALEYIRMSRYKDAATEYELVAQLEPDNAAINYNLAVLYDDYLDDNRKAVFYYKRYLSGASDISADEAERINKWIEELEID